MTQHGHTVANTTGKAEQTTKQQSETKSARDSHHHGLPVVFTTAGGGVAQLCYQACVIIRLLRLSICVFLSCPFVFLRGFLFRATNLPLKKDLFSCKKDLIALIPPFFFFL